MIVSILKFISIVSAAFFGIFASMANFRNKEGKITRNGYIGLTGIICSAILAGFLQVFSDAESSKQSLLLIDKNTEILTDIRRSLNPLEGLEVNFSLEPNWEDKDFKLFYDKIEMKKEPNVTTFGGEFLPTANEEPLLSDVLYEVGIKLFFFRKPIAEHSFGYENISSKVHEDLFIDVINPARYFSYDIPPKENGIVSLQSITKKGKLLRLYLENRNMKISSTSTDWRSNSKIISLFDLLGSQVYIQLDASGLRGDSEFDFSYIENYRKEVRLTELILKVQGGIMLAFDDDNLKKIKSKNGYNLYVFNFPLTMEELLNSTYYNENKQIDLLD